MFPCYARFVTPARRPVARRRVAADAVCATSDTAHRDHEIVRRRTFAIIWHPGAGKNRLTDVSDTMADDAGARVRAPRQRRRRKTEFERNAAEDARRDTLFRKPGKARAAEPGVRIFVVGSQMPCSYDATQRGRSPALPSRLNSA
jgi:hypothetical protein